MNEWSLENSMQQHRDWPAGEMLGAPEAAPFARAISWAELSPASASVVGDSMMLIGRVADGARPGQIAGVIREFVMTKATGAARSPAVDGRFEDERMRPIGGPTGRRRRHGFAWVYREPMTRSTRPRERWQKLPGRRLGHAAGVAQVDEAV